MNQAPRVSVIMPNLNGGKYIGNAIESILNQTFTDLELIVVDNGSSDESCSRIVEYAGRDSRIKFIVCKSKGGSQALNSGIAEAHGEYLARMDSDDVCNPERIAKQVSVLDNHTIFGLCYTDGWVMDEDGTRTGSIRSRDIIGTCPDFDRGDVFRLLLKTDFIIGASIMVKRGALGNERFDESLRVANDWDFSLRLARKMRFKCIEEPLYGYRIHAGATSSFRNAPSNSFYLALVMMRWARTLDMEPEDRKELFSLILAGPPKMLAAVLRRRLGRV